jgi:uncharacterized membrane protein YfcA
MSTQVIITLILIGLAGGVLSGLIGVGGGLVVVPALVMALGYSQHQAQGISLGLMLPPVGILAVMNYYKEGYVDIKVVGVLCIFFIIGAFFGSKMALALPQEKIKKIFAIILFYTAFKMLHWDTVIFSWLKRLWG